MGTSTTALPTPEKKRSRPNTRARVLEAASQVFAEEGFQASTIEQICARAGYTRGAFYSNFRSKEDLFMALFEINAQSLVERVQSVVGSAPFAEVPALLTAYFAEPTEEDRRWFVLSTEFTLHAIRNPEAAKLLADQDKALRDTLAPILGGIFERAGVKPRLPLDRIARALVAFGEGASAQSYVEPGELPPGTLEREFFPLIFAAVSE
jgi:AcrR family transcriptional regulator